MTTTRSCFNIQYSASKELNAYCMLPPARVLQVNGFIENLKLGIQNDSLQCYPAESFTKNTRVVEPLPYGTLGIP